MNQPREKETPARIVVQVPSNVLLECKPPLLSQCCWDQVGSVRRVRITNLLSRGTAIAVAATPITNFSGNPRRCGREVFSGLLGSIISTHEIIPYEKEEDMDK